LSSTQARPRQYPLVAAGQFYLRSNSVNPRVQVRIRVRVRVTGLTLNPVSSGSGYSRDRFGVGVHPLNN